MGRRGSQTGGVSGAAGNSVEVMLAEPMENLGEQGDIVRVKPGYARNYLLPQGLATVATAQNKWMVEQHQLKLKELEQEKVRECRSRADQISRYSATLEANANADGQLYGSIVATDIAKALVAAGYEITADQIRLEGPLKELGMYTVKFELHPKVKSEVKVWVVPTASA